MVSGLQSLHPIYGTGLAQGIPFESISRIKRFPKRSGRDCAPRGALAGEVQADPVSEATKTTKRTKAFGVKADQNSPDVRGRHTAGHFGHLEYLAQGGRRPSK